MAEDLNTAEEEEEAEEVSVFTGMVAEAVAFVLFEGGSSTSVKVDDGGLVELAASTDVAVLALAGTAGPSTQ